jgi:2-haloacid dehalogenase
MLKSDIPETVLLLYKLKAKYKIYGLTNWSAETNSIAYDRFPFFQEFDGIVVSGQEKIIKPSKQFFNCCSTGTVSKQRTRSLLKTI